MDVGIAYFLLMWLWHGNHRDVVVELLWLWCGNRYDKLRLHMALARGSPWSGGGCAMVLVRKGV